MSDANEINRTEEQVLVDKVNLIFVVSKKLAGALFP